MTEQDDRNPKIGASPIHGWPYAAGNDFPVDFPATVDEPRTLAIDAAVAGKVAKAGDTMSGVLTVPALNGPPEKDVILHFETDGAHFLTRGYDIYRPVYVGDPVQPDQAVTKRYLDRRTDSGSTVGSTDSFGDANIAFGVTFTAAPTVVVSFGDFTTGLGSLFVLAGTITTTGCKVRVIGSQNNGQPVSAGTTVRINWIASGT